MPVRPYCLVFTAATALMLLAGCAAPAPVHLERALIGEVLRGSQLSQNLRALCVPGGRLTGTPQAEAACEFMQARLREYGLRNVHSEPFDMSCWTVRQTRATLLTDPPRELADAVALARTMPTPAGGLTAELVDLGEASPDEITARAAEVAGRFVLVRDDRHTRRDRMAAVVAAGGAGLVVMMPPERAPIIGNAHESPRPEPAVGIRHDPDLIARLTRGERIALRLELDVENWPCRPANVVGEIPGRGPLARELVLLGAHLDSWHLAEGALDNGTGATCILEAARALAAVGGPPRRTIRFVWFMAEELGLEGSTAYAAAHAGEFDRIVAMINVDMPGAPRKLGHFGHPEIAGFLAELARDLRGFELDGEIATWSWDASDHYPFMRAGVCALTLAGDMGPGVRNYHTTGDVYDVVDRRATVQSAAVLAVLARRLADAPERPAVRLPPPAKTQPAAGAK